MTQKQLNSYTAVVDGPGDVCILLLILLSPEGLSARRNESSTQVTSCDPSTMNKVTNHWENRRDFLVGQRREEGGERQGPFG